VRRDEAPIDMTCQDHNQQKCPRFHQ